MNVWDGRVDMKIDIKLDKDFAKALKEEIENGGERLAELNGFSDKQLSYTDFIDNFIDKKTVADASIDGNANVGTKDIVSLTSEMSKPHSKLLAFNKIFYEMKKKFGLEEARKWLHNEYDGHYYLHDAYSATQVSYCFAYDLEQLVNKGLFFIDGFNAQPPKHLTTYTDFVGEFVSWTSNRSSGACGLPSFLIYSFYFWKKDCETGHCIKDPEYYRDQEFQRIIYKLNQPYLRVNQSAFTNFSIFDKNYLEALFGDKQYPDGSFVIDYEDEIMEYQKAFMRIVGKVREQNVMTFPVLTYSLLRKNGKFVDEDFAKWCCRHNMKWADSNFFVSDDITSLSNCCFDGRQMTLTKDSNGVHLMTFKDLYEAPYNDTKRNFTVFHNGSWVSGKLTRLPVRDMYKVTTSNKKEIYVTDNHINVTLAGEKSTVELTTNDYLMFNSMSLDSYPEKDQGLTYEQGYLIGMYLGDGCMNHDDARNDVALSLNKEKYESSIDIISRAFEQLGVNCNINLGKEYNHVYPVSFSNKDIKAFISKFVHGKYCNEKELDMNCLLQSREFRKGIIAGYYATDGGNSNRIYTTSSKLVYELEALFTSCGTNTVIDISDRTDEPVIIRGKEYKRNFPLYCIRWYSNSNKRNMKDIYIVRNNSIFFKIVSIEKVASSDDKYVYCFEMPEKEPYFTLPNGLITHNCRLVSDIKNLGYFNSIGGTALEVGSIKVNTINLARIAYESSNKEDYLRQLSDEVKLCCEALDTVRHIITRNIDKGLLPNYSKHIMNLSSQYNTIGIIGIYETLQKFGLTYKDETGNTFYSDDGVEFAKQILAKITDVKNEYSKDKDYQINIEEVPAERAASILMQKDMLFFPNEAYELPLYGNQWIPLGIKTTMQEKIRLSAILDKACSGGSIAHINIDAPFTNFDQAWNLLNYIADQGVIYFAFCTRISACKNNHGFYGETCPICGGPKETTYQRIVGFLTPERSYSKERKAEFAMRDWMDLNAMSDLQ